MTDAPPRKTYLICARITSCAARVYHIAHRNMNCEPTEIYAKIAATRLQGNIMTRREDLRLITGQGRYTADCNLPDQLHTVFLRADRAQAQIVRIDTSKALKHAGVIAVYTDADTATAGFKSLPNPVGFPGRVKSSCTLFSQAQKSSAREVNSVPWSTVMHAGRRTVLPTRLSASNFMRRAWPSRWPVRRSRRTSWPGHHAGPGIQLRQPSGHGRR